MGAVKVNPQLLNEIGTFLQGLVRGFARAKQQQSQQGTQTGTLPGTQAKPKATSSGKKPTTSGTVAATTTAVELDTSGGLPSFDYAPHMDGDPDPGEVVWTWVPYEDDPRQGKDRPVLVIARLGANVAAVQLTSKDHDLDAAQEARWGRYWFEIGTGNWDPKGRVSEARLDRILEVPPAAMRREGGILDEGIFSEVVQAITAHHSNS